MKNNNQPAKRKQAKQEPSLNDAIAVYFSFDLDPYTTTTDQLFNEHALYWYDEFLPRYWLGEITTRCFGDFIKALKEIYFHVIEYPGQVSGLKKKVFETLETFNTTDKLIVIDRMDALVHLLPDTYRIAERTIKSIRCEVKPYFADEAWINRGIEWEDSVRQYTIEQVRKDISGIDSIEEKRNHILKLLCDLQQDILEKNLFEPVMTFIHDSNFIELCQNELTQLDLQSISVDKKPKRSTKLPRVNKLEDIFIDKETFRKCIDAAKAVGIVNERCDYILGRHEKGAIAAWIGVCKERGKLNRGINDRPEIARLLNDQFDNLEMGIYGRVLSEANSSYRKYRPKLLAHI